LAEADAEEREDERRAARLMNGRGYALGGRRPRTTEMLMSAWKTIDSVTPRRGSAEVVGGAQAALSRPEEHHERRDHRDARQHPSFCSPIRRR